jgi:guanine deaminase
VVKDGVVIATGVNHVTRTNDPTTHAEIVAIRESCRVLGSFQLTGCDVYSSCEPCPMCLAALYWSRPERVVYAATRNDAAAAGFDDAAIYEQIALPPAGRSLPMVQLADDHAERPFVEWVNKADRKAY